MNDRIERLERRIQRLRSAASVAETPLSSRINKLADQMTAMVQQIRKEGHRKAQKAAK